MAESIFTSETPLGTDVNDATTYTLGTCWTPAVNGTVTHIRVFAPLSAPAVAFQGVLYSITGEASGTELSRATFGALTPGAWNTVALPSPVAVTAGNYYVTSYVTTDFFVLTTFVFTSAGITNGNLTANQSGVPFGNGRIHVGDGFPEITSGQQSNYFADVVFEAGGAAQDILPGGLATGEAIGSATLTPGAVTISPGGLASGEAVGAATLTPGAVTIAPGGLASGEAVGAATITPGAVTISPSGLPSEEVIGAATLAPGAVTISPAGLPSGEAIGTASLINAGVQTISPVGLPSGERVGSPVVWKRIVRACDCSVLLDD